MNIYIWYSYLLCWVVANSAFAQIQEEKTALREVVISARKFEQNQREVAQNVQRISAKEIAIQNASTTADLLQNSGEVLVQKSQLGGGSPIMRGFEANKVLMVVDGIRMNNAIYRGGHLQNIVTIDANSLEKVELLYGSSATIYGSDALGGVINFQTKKPVLNANTASAFARYTSALTEKTGNISLNIGSKRWASFTGLTYSSFGNLVQGSNRSAEFPEFGKIPFLVVRENGIDVVKTNANANQQTPTGYNQVDLLQKIYFQASSNVSHLLNIQYSNSSNVPRYDRLTETVNNLPRFAEWYYGPQKRLLAAYQVELKNTKMYDRAKISLAFQDIDESRHSRRLNAIAISRQLENVKVWSLNADFTKELLQHRTLFYGIEATDNNVTSVAYNENKITGATTGLNTRYPDGGSTMRSLAGYFDVKKRFSPKITSEVGLRFSASFLSARFNDKIFFPFPFNNIEQNNANVSTNIGLIYLPNDSWKVAFLANTGFRTPNVDDLTKVFESVKGVLNVPNPNIKPEKTRTLELNCTKIVGRHLKLSGAVYYTNYTDIITTLPSTYNGQKQLEYQGVLSNVVSSTNAANGYIYGYSLRAEIEINKYISMQGHLSYTYGRIKTDTTDYPLDHISPLYGKFNVCYKNKRFRTDVFMLFSGAKELKDYNLVGEDNYAYATSKGMPAWQTFNMKLSYQTSAKTMLQAGLENIFDTNYRVFASGISASGRSLTLALRYGL